MAWAQIDADVIVKFAFSVPFGQKKPLLRRAMTLDCSSLSGLTKRNSHHRQGGYPAQQTATTCCYLVLEQWLSASDQAEAKQNVHFRERHGRAHSDNRAFCENDVC